jgi:hypothetical protein
LPRSLEDQQLAWAGLSLPDGVVLKTTELGSLCAYDSANDMMMLSAEQAYVCEAKSRDSCPWCLQPIVDGSSDVCSGCFLDTETRLPSYHSMLPFLSSTPRATTTTTSAASAALALKTIDTAIIALSKVCRLRDTLALNVTTLVHSASQLSIATSLIAPNTAEYARAAREYLKARIMLASLNPQSSFREIPDFYSPLKVFAPLSGSLLCIMGNKQTSECSASASVAIDHHIQEIASIRTRMERCDDGGDERSHPVLFNSAVYHTSHILALVGETAYLTPAIVQSLVQVLQHTVHLDHCFINMVLDYTACRSYLKPRSGLPFDMSKMFINTDEAPHTLLDALYIGDTEAIASEIQSLRMLCGVDEHKQEFAQLAEATYLMEVAQGQAEHDAYILLSAKNAYDRSTRHVSDRQLHVVSLQSKIQHMADTQASMPTCLGFEIQHNLQSDTSDDQDMEPVSEAEPSDLVSEADTDSSYSSEHKSDAQEPVTVVKSKKSSKPKPKKKPTVVERRRHEDDDDDEEPFTLLEDGDGDDCRDASRGTVTLYCRDYLDDTNVPTVSKDHTHEDVKIDMSKIRLSAVDRVQLDYDGTDDNLERVSVYAMLQWYFKNRNTQKKRNPNLAKRWAVVEVDDAGTYNVLTPSDYRTTHITDGHSYHVWWLRTVLSSKSVPKPVFYLHVGTDTSTLVNNKHLACLHSVSVHTLCTYYDSDPVAYAKHVFKDTGLKGLRVSPDVDCSVQNTDGYHPKMYVIQVMSKDARRKYYEEEGSIWADEPVDMTGIMRKTKSKSKSKSKAQKPKSKKQQAMVVSDCDDDDDEPEPIEAHARKRKRSVTTDDHEDDDDDKCASAKREKRMAAADAERRMQSAREQDDDEKALDRLEAIIVPCDPNTQDSSSTYPLKTSVCFKLANTAQDNGPFFTASQWDGQPQETYDFVFTPRATVSHLVQCVLANPQLMPTTLKFRPLESTKYETAVVMRVKAGAARCPFQCTGDGAKHTFTRGYDPPCLDSAPLVNGGTYHVYLVQSLTHSVPIVFNIPVSISNMDSFVLDAYGFIDMRAINKFIIKNHSGHSFDHAKSVAYQIEGSVFERPVYLTDQRLYTLVGDYECTKPVTQVTVLGHMQDTNAIVWNGGPVTQQKKDTFARHNAHMESLVESVTEQDSLFVSE